MKAKAITLHKSPLVPPFVKGGLGGILAIGFLTTLLPWTTMAEPAAISSTPASQAIYWNKTPIALTLRVGGERIVHFPKPGSVKVGVPEHLDEQYLRVQVLENTVYWLAKQPFETERVQVMNLQNGEIFLFDLSAKSDGDVAPVEILSTGPVTPTGVPTNSSGKKEFDYVTLTRFAAQQMYAPKRLVKDISGVVRVPVPTESAVPLVRGGKVEALPLISWRAGEYYVTVVRLKNVTADAVTFDPRQLRGNWLSATFQHARVLPKGYEADTTCVYLISSRPFEVAMAPFLNDFTPLPNPLPQSLPQGERGTVMRE